jgi:2-keto-4-pentenoate hydratase/2-oxohepta-3-ene-1,7-dioic acid hydratase in catechol pathway
MGFRLGCVAGRAVLVDGDHVYDVEEVSGGALPAEPRLVVAEHGQLHDLAAELGDAAPTSRLVDVTLGTPVPWPRHVFGVGLNYRTHAEETGQAIPEAPLVFTKFPGCLAPPVSELRLASDTTDYEAELVVVIGAEAKDVAGADAWGAVAGLMVGQDVSDRALQMAGDRPQFNLGKSHDGYGPTGPLLVSPDLVPDPDDLAVECTVNGEVRQSDRTANLIFSVAELVSYLSGVLTLRPGDLIFTGTPAGVGAPTRTFLRPGDTVVTTIEGLGSLTMTCH